MKNRIRKKVEKRKRLEHLENRNATLEGLLKRQSARIRMLETEIGQEQKVLCAVLRKAGKEIIVTGEDVATAPLYVVKHKINDKNDIRKSEYTFVRVGKRQKSE